MKVIDIKLSTYFIVRRFDAGKYSWVREPGLDNVAENATKHRSLSCATQVVRGLLNRHIQAEVVNVETSVMYRV